MENLAKQIFEAVQFEDHPKYDLYQCSKQGRYKHKDSEFTLKGAENQNDKYLRATVKTKGGKQKVVTVHRLIWSCFNGDIPRGKEINHIDGNPQNNALDNLELVDHAQNLKLRNMDMKIVTRGNAHAHKRIVQAEFKKDDGNIETLYFTSQSQAGKYFSVNAGMVNHHITGFVKNDIRTNGGYVRFRQVFEKPDDKDWTVVPNARIGQKYKKKVKVNQAEQPEPLNPQ